LTATRRNRGGLRSAAFAALLICAGGVHAQATECDDLRGLPINFGVLWLDDIKPIFNELLGGRCTSCHNEGSGQPPNLTDIPVDAIYSIVNANSYVIPNEVASSFLFEKINCRNPSAGNGMPFNATPLTIAQQALIYDWIEQGALGEPKDEIFRDGVFRDGAESLRWY